MPTRRTLRPAKRYHIANNESGTKFHGKKLCRMVGAPPPGPQVGGSKGGRQSGGRASSPVHLPTLARLINGKRCTFLVLTASSELKTPKRTSGLYSQTLQLPHIAGHDQPEDEMKSSRMSEEVKVTKPLYVVCVADICTVPQ
ncbi:hypothetical protein E2C01_083444 [Portunus trituberculatus]|uniref:Uncharacterized protein n=1 Tax=Portunus trituberculatus TaxID=210409 RepID=A0A5B7J187_PORTR|nr:hypothetical protein [Portunus trituberculatus]